MKHNNTFSDQCINAASETLTQVVDELAKLGCKFCLYFLDLNMRC